MLQVDFFEKQVFRQCHSMRLKWIIRGYLDRESSSTSREFRHNKRRTVVSGRTLRTVRAIAVQAIQMTSLFLFKSLTLPLPTVWGAGQQQRLQEDALGQSFRGFRAHASGLIRHGHVDLQAAELAHSLDADTQGCRPAQSLR
jgi:hypothetical protein